MSCKGKRRLTCPLTKIAKTKGGPNWQRGDIPLRLSYEGIDIGLFWGGKILKLYKVGVYRWYLKPED